MPAFRECQLPTSPGGSRQNAARQHGGRLLDGHDTLLIAAEAAELLRLSQRTLERHRTAGTGPRFVRLGRAIRYRRGDLIDFVERCAHQSTSEAA